MDIQLNPAITDLKGPIIFIHYRRISAIANLGKRAKFCQGTEKLFPLMAEFCYSWIPYCGIQLYSDEHSPLFVAKSLDPTGKLVFIAEFIGQAQALATLVNPPICVPKHFLNASVMKRFCS